ncbi:sensor histidine kinase [Streptomyces sp. NPDC101227]|uniref:sensor histidine kinase n=1 Tax=Streptomyces sp. NPDC101227 TaxID=3366136 RepID=UPI0037F286C8
MGRVRAKWQARTRFSQVDFYCRWSLYLIPWLMVLAAVAPVLGQAGGRPLPLALAGLALGLTVAQGLLMIRLLDRALGRYLKQGPTPARLLVVSGALTVVAEVCVFAVVVVRREWAKDDLVAMMLAAIAIPALFCLACSLVMSKRKYLASLVGVAAALMVLAGLGTQEWGGGLGLAAIVLFGGIWSFVIARPTGWLLSMFWELDRARSAQARLAVAEERLRFGRDLHDVMGRNLAVIALKSELAVQLARRERPEAVDQMVEVQRVAQESQREVREVVRGYRKADLQAELAGARSILRAAGVDCRIEGEEGTQLPAAAQSALGWVVREGTTNVLRHAIDVRRCTLRTRIDAQRSVLVMTVENDGVAPSAGGVLQTSPGNGLKGLRERLEPLGGTLVAGPGLDGCYRLTVELPLGAAGDGDLVGVGDGAAGGVSDG